MQNILCKYVNVNTSNYSMQAHIVA